MARPDIPDKLAIIFDPDRHDSWAWLTRRQLYLPTGARTAANVAAIGLTGTLDSSGPIGNYWNDGNVILVMDGPAVKRENRLSPIYYDNLNAMVADHFRAIRRIIGQPFISQVREYTLLAVASLGSPEFLAAYEKGIPPDPMGINLTHSTVEPGGNVKAAWRDSFNRFAARGNFNTVAEMERQLNRFVPDEAERIIASRSSESDDTPFFWWQINTTTRGEYYIRAYTGKDHLGQRTTVTLGQFRRGIELARKGIPERLVKHLENGLRTESKGFSDEIEWLANPTPDRRTGGLSVLLNIPPLSIAYLIGRSLSREIYQTVAMTFAGLWVVSVPDDMTKFERINLGVQDAIFDYTEGTLDLEGVYAAAKRLGADLIAPNIYWITRQER